MNELGGWFRQFLARLTAGFRSFMVGRYGTDRLNMAILGVGLVASLLKKFKNLFTCVIVKSTRRLITKQKLRVFSKSTCNRNTLLLTT